MTEKEKIRGIVILMIALISLMSCRKKEGNSLETKINYEQKMRDFVKDISSYAKAINPDFAIIPQNGIELVYSNGSIHQDYINAIDAVGQEDLNYGYNKDNEKTPDESNQWIRFFLDITKNNSSVKIMVTDYCSSLSKIENSYSVNNSNGYISFAANHRGLDNIPNHAINKENSNIITNLQQVKNFLYLIDSGKNFKNKEAFVKAVTKTNYDCIIMDFFHNGEEFTVAQIEQLKKKKNGGKRLLISYMSIGESESYRYYWQSNWRIGNPSFIEKENPKWLANYVVRYWDPKWQNIIFGNDNSYLKKILDSGFDGVYLDIIDAYEQF